ncbi:MAG TPA: CDP-diacylglycerol--serine O-phosphatidyltransferase [Tissierellia bacterium]|nr:CDP-diacylglycerol--serine O-phosphatidyltransferase [Tissierellia bacterium]
MKVILSRNLANAITLANMGLGILALIMATSGQLSLSVSLILMAGLFDRFDGMVARRMNITSELGVQLDSLSDLISFGISPALIVFIYKFSSHPKFLVIGSIATVLYVLCGGLRLARYNVTGTIDDHFVGVPITLCGMLLALSLLFERVSPIVYAGFMIILAYLMISHIPIRKR